MNTTQRLTGLALAVLLTVTMLGGIDRLAHPQADPAYAARTTAPAAAEA